MTACTRKICRIGYSHNFSISTKDCDGKELETSLFRDREDLTKTVKGIVKTVSSDIVYVDIGMPLSMLQVYDNMIFFLLLFFEVFDLFSVHPISVYFVQ